MTPQPNPSEELKPCPFCGGKSTVCMWFSVDGRGRPDTYMASCVFGCGTSSAELTRENAIAAWNRRALPPSFVEQDLTVSQSQPCAESGPNSPPSAEGEEFLEFKEALSDIRSLRHEYDCLNGGGPEWSKRNRDAWARVDELFANEDEAAYDRQQEDAHG